jgi:hypothetical protein
MIEIPDLTPKPLADLGKELGGCDFTDESQRRFLECSTSRRAGSSRQRKNYASCPKLALLSRDWSSRTQGVWGFYGDDNGVNVECEGNAQKIWASHGRPHRHTAVPICAGRATIRLAREVYGIADPDEKQMGLF